MRDLSALELDQVGGGANWDAVALGAAIVIAGTLAAATAPVAATAGLALAATGLQGVGTAAAWAGGAFAGWGMMMGGGGSRHAHVTMTQPELVNE